MNDQREQDRLDLRPRRNGAPVRRHRARSGELLSKFLERHADGAVRPIADELGISKAFFEAWARMLADPLRTRRGADEAVAGLLVAVAELR